MKIFVSHSGERSRALAELVSRFVRQLIHAAEPWFSPDIPKGARWLQELSQELEASGAGIVCLTRENLAEPWILFESGALAKHLGHRVYTLLLDVDPLQVELPLAQFQHTNVADREDVWRLVSTLTDGVRQAGGKVPLDAELRTLFDDYHWPRFMKDLERIQAMPAPAGPPARKLDEMVAEVLASVREMGSGSAAVQAQQEKTLGLVNLIYTHLFETVPPSLAELVRRKFVSEPQSSNLDGLVEQLILRERLRDPGEEQPPSKTPWTDRLRAASRKGRPSEGPDGGA